MNNSGCRRNAPLRRAAEKAMCLLVEVELCGTIEIRRPACKGRCARLLVR